jgi:predicted nucleic acid-binding protein
MAEINYLIDTNVIIDFLAGKLPKKSSSFVNTIIDKKPNISVISKIELLVYNTTDKDYKLLTDFIKNCIVFQLNEDIISHTIDIRKKYKIKLPDAIITPTALVEKLELITRNISDFDKVEGLKIINPYDL